MNVLVTGAGGFIGYRLCLNLIKQGHKVTGLDLFVPENIEFVFHQTDITQDIPVSYFKNIDVVFHLAGKAHALAEVEQDHDEYFKINTLGTQKVLEACKSSNVKRFVLFSTIKAMGEGNPPDEPLVPINETALCHPLTPYGESKWEAEKLLLEKNYVPEPVVLRLCMVYGGKVKGNLFKMIQAIQSNRFPPIPEFLNKRSMVHVDDVVKAAQLAAESSKAPGQVFIVSDNFSYSTKWLYNTIRMYLQKKELKWSIPNAMLKILGKVGDFIGKVRGRRFFFDSDAYLKLAGSAYYSNTKIKEYLNFTPARELSESIKEMVQELDR